MQRMLRGESQCIRSYCLCTHLSSFYRVILLPFHPFLQGLLEHSLYFVFLEYELLQQQTLLVTPTAGVCYGKEAQTGMHNMVQTSP